MAMARAGVQPGEIDVIILGTATPDHLLPATAVEIQTALGCTRAAAFDISAACSGWLYAAIMGESLIASGSADTVLVIGAEMLSTIVDWTDRNTCILFADGAGATVLRRNKERGGTKGVLSSFMRSDGALSELLWRPAGGGAEPFSPEVFEQKRHYVRMAGREVFKHAVRSMAEATDRALDSARLTAADIDLLNGFGKGDILAGNRGLEWIKIHHHKIDGTNAVGLSLLLVVGIAADIEQPSMDAGMEGLHATLEDFRRASELRYLNRRDAGRLKLLGSAPCGEDFDTLGRQPTGEFHNTGFVGNGDQRSLNFHFWKGETLGVDETEFNNQHRPCVFSFAVRGAAF
jgi:hypothetical protein